MSHKRSWVPIPRMPRYPACRIHSMAKPSTLNLYLIPLYCILIRPGDFTILVVFDPELFPFC